MVKYITSRQEDELDEARSNDMQEYHRLLEEYAGIKARPYTAYTYYDAAGNYVGSSELDCLCEILEAAYIEVVEEAGGDG